MENSEKESKEIIARTQDGGGGSGWPLFFFLSLRRICVRVIIFLRPAMETHTYSGEKQRRREKRERERKKKECRDLFHPSAAFGTS